jgi:hypothetical protein
MAPKHGAVDARAHRIQHHSVDQDLMFDANPALVEAATREAAANLTRTTPSWDEYLAALADRHGLPKFVERLRSWNPKDVEQPTAPSRPGKK